MKRLNRLHVRLQALNILMHPSFADRESVRGVIKGFGKKRAGSALAKPESSLGRL